MGKIIVELVIVAMIIILATVLLKKNPTRIRKSFAISFVLVLAVMIAFTIAQLSSQFMLLDISLVYTPLDVLSLLALIYCFSVVSANSTFFDKLIGK